MLYRRFEQIPYPIHMPFLHKMLSFLWQEPRIIVEAGSALQLIPEQHAGRIIKLTRAAGCAVKLPAALGTGEQYEIWVGTTNSGGSTTITKKTGTSDTFVGQLETSTTTGATTNGYCESLGGSDVTITMSGTTTGGIVGSRIRFTDFGSGVWLVDGALLGSGTLASSVS